MITKHKAIDRYRQLEKLQKREKNDEFILEQSISEDVQISLLEKDEKNTLLLALSTLKDIDREIFMMKYFLYLTTQEIAESLNLSISAVENRLYRGKKKLAKNPILRERFI